MKIFISYTWTDTPTRIAVASVLEKLKNVEVFYDRKNLIPSESLTKGIQKGLSEAALVIAILTDASIKSGGVRDEIARAHENKKPILPIISTTVDEKDIPPYLQDILSIRFNNSDIDAALLELSQKLIVILNQSDKEKNVNSSIDDKIEKKDDSYTILQRSDVGRNIIETVIDSCKVFQFSFSLDNDTEIFPLFVSPNTFVPDDWTRCFLKGIFKIRKKLSESTVITEIGMGSAIIPIVLSYNNLEFSRYYGFDIDSLVTKLAQINIDIYKISDKVTAAGGTSLFNPEIDYDIVHPYTDLIIANIPQVPTLSTGPIRELFDYYAMPVSPQNDERLWAMRGLYLISKILVKGNKRLKNGGGFIFNIGVRTSIDNVKTMISDLGYKSEIIYASRIKQDPETDISSFVHFEDTESEHYIFYPDKEATSVISAREAYSRMVQGKTVYHDINVLHVTRK